MDGSELEEGGVEEILNLVAIAVRAGLRAVIHTVAVCVGTTLVDISDVVAVQIEPLAQLPIVRSLRFARRPAGCQAVVQRGHCYRLSRISPWLRPFGNDGFIWPRMMA